MGLIEKDVNKFEFYYKLCYYFYSLKKGVFLMKHVKTLNKANLKESAIKGGCGECQASCQSACKTSCTVANQKCEK